MHLKALVALEVGVYNTPSKNPIKANVEMIDINE